MAAAAPAHPVTQSDQKGEKGGESLPWDEAHTGTDATAGGCQFLN